MRLVRDLGLVVLVLAGAVGGSQVPRFVQEYEQRLGGALQEAQRQLDEFRAVAGRSGLAFEAYVGRLRASQDPGLAGTGETIGGIEQRAGELGAQARALERAPRLLKPLVLLARHDRELLASTWGRFGWTLTLEPYFALAGAGLGWLLNTLVWLRPSSARAAAGARPS